MRSLTLSRLPEPISAEMAGKELKERHRLKEPKPLIRSRRDCALHRALYKTKLLIEREIKDNSSVNAK